jgi:hypothetical protein
MGRLTTWSAGCAVFASLGFAVMTAMPASAALVMGTSGICPATQVGSTQHGAVGSAGLGNATDCNLVITFNADGSITTTAGSGTNYESIEDALIGVVNNSGQAITSFNLSNPGTDIFGFDGDGIDVYTFDDNPTLHEADIASLVGDTTGYGGLYAFFTNINGAQDTGTVNFGSGGIASGSTGFFSLEEPASLNLRVTGVPEPATLTLLGAGLAAAGGFRLRRKAKKA